MIDKDKPATGSVLRRQAEEIAHRQGLPSPEGLADLRPEAAQQIVQELQVHQIELEMQNHEPVSYTHLDVYKRQLWHRAAIVCRLTSCSARWPRTSTNTPSVSYLSLIHI